MTDAFFTIFLGILTIQHLLNLKPFRRLDLMKGSADVIGTSVGNNSRNGMT